MRSDGFLAAGVFLTTQLADAAKMVGLDVLTAILIAVVAPLLKWAVLVAAKKLFTYLKNKYVS